MSELLKKEHLLKTEVFVQETLHGDSGHDWWHIHRVRNNALSIAKQEEADLFIVEMAALLHDIADHKFHDGDDTIGQKVAREWLSKIDVEVESINHICQIIKDVSFKGAEVETPMNSIEGEIVQDADRLDAIGAIGVARAFSYGGYKSRALYNPDIPPTFHTSFDEYKNDKGHTINHFYEKLFLLKDRMNTKSGKKLAEERHNFMKIYVDTFLKEWNGN